MTITTEMHMCMSVRGFLSNRKYPGDFEGMFTRSDGAKMNAQESRDYLYDCLARGREKIPFADCDNFDNKHGCRGHQVDTEGKPIKPLFIPLKSIYFDSFVSGYKDTEYREYGPRWNEETCFVGRHVVLSKGYGKKSRIYGKVVGFEKKRASSFEGKDRMAIVECYGSIKDIDIACIRIETKNEVYTAD